MAVAVDPECHAHKQIEVIVSESLLPQEYKGKYVTKCESALYDDEPTKLLYQ